MYWHCPLCHTPLQAEERTFRCAHGHAFDQAREGYVNLLPAHRTHSAHPGDDTPMLRSRRAFLDQGYYQRLAELLAAQVTPLLSTAGTRPPGEPFALLDTGCGEGYYTGFIARTLAAIDPHTPYWLGGIDIAKEAVRMAAKRHPDIAFAVASTAGLPVANASLDAVLRIFAPGHSTELRRVLRPGGHFICATPGPRHLYALRQLIYDNPREHDARVQPLDGLEHVQRSTIDSTMTVTGADNVAHLLAMTPYYWQADEKTQRAIATRDTLHTEVAFRIDIYKRHTL